MDATSTDVTSTDASSTDAPGTDATSTTPQTAVAAGEGFTSSTAGAGAVSDPGPASSAGRDREAATVPVQAGGERLAGAGVATTGTPAALRSALERIVPAERVLTRPVDLVMYASDASVYRMLPQAVVLADGVEEVRALLAHAAAAVCR